MNNATIVTAFYPLSKSKHALGEYHSWIQNFCTIPHEMVIFTDDAHVAMFSDLRKEYASKTRIIARDFLSYKMTTPEMMTFWKEQNRIDPNKNLHGHELYAIWALKQELVELAIFMDPFGHEWYVWCDVGICRCKNQTHYYAEFPTKTHEICAKDAINMLEVHRISEVHVRNFGKSHVHAHTNSTTIGGGCIAGTKHIWSQFSREYRTMLADFSKRGWFSGIDEPVYFAMLMEERIPFRMFIAKSFGPGTDLWFSFPVMLAGKLPVVLDTRFSKNLKMTCSNVESRKSNGSGFCSPYSHSRAMRCR